MDTSLPNNSNSKDSADQLDLSLLYSLDQVVASTSVNGLDLEDLLPEVLRLSYHHLDVDVASIVVVDQMMEVVDTWFIDNDESETKESAHIDEILASGLAGTVLRSGTAAIVEDTLIDPRWHKHDELETSQNSWSAISAPVKVGERVVGVITLAKVGIKTLFKEDLDILLQIAKHISTTIENARLYDDLEKRAHGLEALITATGTMRGSLEIEHLMQDVAEQITKLLNVEACAIFIRDINKNTLTLQVEHAPEHWEIRPERYRAISLDRLPFTQKVLTKGHPTQLHATTTDLNDEEYQLKFDPQLKIRSVLMIPLVADGEIKMLAEVMQTTHRQFSKHDNTIAQIFGAQAAMVIQNASLYRAAERQLKVSKLLNEAGKMINSSLDLQEIMHSLLIQMNELLLVENSSIALYDKPRNEMIYEVAAGLGRQIMVGLRVPAGIGVLGWVVENREPTLIPNVKRDDRFHPLQDGEFLGLVTRSMMCAPLIIKDEVIGTIQSINALQGEFQAADLELLISLANLASSALGNAQQFSRTQAAEARFTGLFEDSIDPILITDEDGNMIAVNRKSADFLHYSREALLQMNIMALFPDSEWLIEEHKMPTLRMNQVAEYISTVVTRNEQLIPVTVHVKRFELENSIALQWIYHDISKKVELEKMRDDLMAMLFHDLQNPLSNIISSLELLEFDDAFLQDQEQAAIVDIALRGGKRLQVLLRSLLDLNHLEAGRPLQDLTFTDLGDVINEARELVEPAMKKKAITLFVNLTESLPQVFIDGNMVRRIFINLLHNAQKFSSYNSQITISAFVDRDANQIVLSIADQGMGIPHEHKPYIFEKYKQAPGGAKKKYQGRGLGLAFCRLAVLAHGGRIWVTDATPKGAQFNFTLPMKEFDPKAIRV